uniref:leucine-rich repeat-containing protein 19 isoform X1 n=1 Tax=Maylandia zebra TaxID=106582 RepID=UPI000D2F5F07|nr:leucine-rich repeat-containing protein 19 isoform X1 [Maylandia zebra]
MERCWQPLLLLWLTVGLVKNNETVNCSCSTHQLTANFTNKHLQVIPENSENVNVTKLMIEGNLITLNDTDKQALASYPSLVELHLDANWITAIPAKYFSVVPNLRVLSLARNNISSLHPQAFSDLEVLTELDLTHNLLTSLPAQLISGLNKLQVLNLQGNPWNCSCPLLTIIGQIDAANVTMGRGPQVICASPAEQAGRDLLNAAALYSTLLPSVTPDPQKPKTPVHPQQTSGPSVIMTTTQSTGQNNSTSKDPTPALGNTWKFTASVAILAVAISMLIVCAVKGPSWYKLFHNYRHRQLQQEVEEGDEDFVSTEFSATGRHPTHQTFSFEPMNRQIDEEQEYFEDPYIRREE